MGSSRSKGEESLGKEFRAESLSIVIRALEFASRASTVRSGVKIIGRRPISIIQLRGFDPCGRGRHSPALKDLFEEALARQPVGKTPPGKELPPCGVGLHSARIGGGFEASPLARSGGQTAL